MKKKKITQVFERAQYIKRVDDFFEFNDKNNCKRVYDAIKKMDYD